MIISRTPYRISFIGGGTDYPIWFKEHGGASLGVTIDKYCYISLRYLPQFFEHKYRILWSKIELCQKIDDISHPAVRECLRFMNIDRGVEIHHDGDLPARTGIGSSSSFTVGLLNALYTLKGIQVPPSHLASEAIYIEQEVIQEAVGSQDQVCAAYGGFNRIDFNKDGTFKVTPVKGARWLEKYLMLFYTGFQRTASQIAEEQIALTPFKTKELSILQKWVDDAELYIKGRAIQEFGQLLDAGWKLKRELSPKISNPYIDYLYERAQEAGALGGKILGAGGGGFLLLYAVPEKQVEVRKAMSGLLEVPFTFTDEGSKILSWT